MKKKIIDSETRKIIVETYINRNMPVDKMAKYLNVSSRIFYRVLDEENIEVKRRIVRKTPLNPKQYHIELIGKRYNNLIVKDIVITDKSIGNTYRCLCICDCGQENDYPPSDIVKGLRKTCGKENCHYHRQDYSNYGTKNIKFTGFNEISGQRWKSIECGAIRRGLEFTITIQFIWNLFIEQNRKCKYSGRDIFFGKTNTKESTASLDRIDSSKGYIESNVQWVHKNINIMKMSLSHSEFINICKEVCYHEDK